MLSSQMCCNYEFSNHYVLITLHFHSIFRKCFPSVAAPGIWFSSRSVGFFFFLVAFKTWNKFAFDFYWHIRVFIDRFNLHFDFISIWISQLLWLVVLANKAKAFCIYLRRLVVFFFFVISVFVYLHFYFIFFFCICILFLRRHKLVAATSRWVQQKHTHLPYL